MTPEPVYCYVKGKGWVANGTPFVKCIMQCGTKVRIEARKPETGEYLGYTVKRPNYYNEWCNEDGTPNLERFKKSMEDERLEWRRQKKPHDDNYSGTEATRVWVTIVPVYE